LEWFFGLELGVLLRVRTWSGISVLELEVIVMSWSLKWYLSLELGVVLRYPSSWWIHSTMIT